MPDTEITIHGHPKAVQDPPLVQLISTTQFGDVISIVVPAAKVKGIMVAMAKAADAAERGEPFEPVRMDLDLDR